MTQRVVVRDRLGRVVRDDAGAPPPVAHDHPIHAFMNVPCVVHHTDPGAVDEYGDHPLSILSSTDELCALQQSTTGEQAGIETEKWALFFKPGVDIDANDSVDVQNMTFQVLGNPWVVTDPLTGWATHIQAQGQRTR